MGNRVEEWLEGYRRGTRVTYMSAMKYLSEYLGKDPGSLIEERIQLWGDRARLRANDRYIDSFFHWLREEKGIASKTAQTYYSAVRSLCQWHGVGLGKSPRTIQAATEFEAGEYPTQKELARMVDIARGWRNKTVITLLAQSGIRISMAAALKIKNIEGYQSGWVLKRIVWDPEQREHYDFKRANVLCFGPETAEYIALILDERATTENLTSESWLFCSNLKPTKSCMMERKRSLEGRSLNRIVRGTAIAAGLVRKERPRKRYRIHAHSLRRFFYNALVWADTPEVIREYLMNHAISAVTKTYFDNSDQGHNEVLQAYEKAYTYLSIRTPELTELRVKHFELQREFETQRRLLESLRQSLTRQET